jgi:hypothetical protein
MTAIVQSCDGYINILLLEAYRSYELLEADKIKRCASCKNVKCLASIPMGQADGFLIVPWQFVQVCYKGSVSAVITIP